MQGEFFYWGPLLYKNKVSQKLIDGLLKRGNESNIDFRSHLAGILKKESKYNMEDKQFFVNEIGTIMSDYAHTYEKYYGENLEGKVFQLEDLWINYMHPGDYNPLHVHTEDISALLIILCLRLSSLTTVYSTPLIVPTSPTTASSQAFIVIPFSAK